MVTRRGLRIPRHHGGALDDEHRFSPGTFMTFGEGSIDAPGRHALAMKLAEGIGFDADEVPRLGLFRRVDHDELATLAGDSVDLQLHTHRHERVGDLSARQTEWLGELGIESATTTRHGFNYPDTPKMLLNRFLNSETISDIEFEAELCGFFETLRGFGIRI